MLVGDVAFDVTLEDDRKHRRRAQRLFASSPESKWLFMFQFPHHVNEVGQDTLHLVDVDILHLHHPQSHQEGLQRQLVSPQQQIPADRNQSGYGSCFRRLQRKLFAVSDFFD